MAEQKIMTRVMKLLDRANHPETPEAERDACMAKAEALMAEHMIDRMDLKAEEPTKVLRDTWDVRVGDGAEFSHALSHMMTEVLTHCGIRVHPKYGYGETENGARDYQVRRYSIVGFPEDMAFAEAIWFRVFRDFVSNINPQWDKSKPLSENVYQFARAGLSWGDIHAKATRNGETLPPLLNGGGAKLRDMYRKACEERGEEYNKTRTHDAYRNSFVQSYSATIGRRLSEARRLTKETVSDADKYAVALRSTKERVDEEFYKLFPEYDPAVIRRMREAEEFEAACAFAALSPEEQEAAILEVRLEDEKWNRRMNRATRARRNYGSVREKKTYDHAAWARGQSVASKVNLNVDPEMKTKKKGELG